MTDLSKEFNPDPKHFSNPKLPTPVKKVSEKNSNGNGGRKPTGELALFKQIYVEQGGKCWLTGNPTDFHPNCFMHILSKGAFPRFRLYKPNIKFVEQDAHYLYDNGSMEQLLQQYPTAVKIYDLKELLKIEYHQPQPTV